MTLSVSAWLEGEARPVMAVMGARESLKCLSDLSDFQKYLKLRVKNLQTKDSLPLVVRHCLKACQVVSHELTSLAAVAGAVAQVTLKEVASQGADQVIVNNGGDIALLVAPGQLLKVGLRPQADEPGARIGLIGALKVSYESGIQGVASSGWQGRSLSPGVADLVTVWAKSAALADAAATFIAGRCRVDAPGIKQAPANELDPDSDLGNMPVTTEVPPLDQEQRRAALDAGLTTAKALMRQKAILGCRIEVQGISAILDATGCAPQKQVQALPGD
jgi:ApbE superfamily uncharacterized protein (UPF0280 family)